MQRARYHASALLMHFDGANLGTVFTDSSGQDQTWVIDADSPVTSSTQVKFGATSYRGNLDHTTNVGIKNNNGPDIFAGDWTVEAWVWPVDLANGNMTLFAATAILGPPLGFPLMEITLNVTGNVFGVHWQHPPGGGEEGGNFPGSVLTAATWNAIAVVKHNDVISGFLNGVKNATTYSVTDTGMTGMNFWKIGGLGRNGAPYMYGYIDEIRVSRIARYGSSYTPASAAFNY